MRALAVCAAVGRRRKENAKGGASIIVSAMPVRTEVIPERKLVLTTGSGAMSDKDFLQAREELLSNPAFRPTFDRIWDFSAVNKVDLSDSAISQLVGTSPSGNRVWRAVVCTEPTTVARVKEIVTASRTLGREIALSPTLATAEEWIQSLRANPPTLS